MSEKIAIFGTGYVGLVTGVCLARVGNDVTCVDIDEQKIKLLLGGECPIYEPKLKDYMIDTIELGRLKFTTDVQSAVMGNDIIMIAVGTPPDEDGSADLQHVLSVATTIGKYINGHKVIVTKSTVPPKTGYKVQQKIQEVIDASAGKSFDFDVVSNPEFLKEGNAVDDFLKPERIVIGTDSPKARSIMESLYRPFMRQGYKVIFMDRISAELTKYAANAMLASRISLMNETAKIAEGYGADIEQIRQGIGSDSRIGKQFLYAGPGYGGSCFPKDVTALALAAAEVGIKPILLEAISEVNQAQRSFFTQKIMNYYNDVIGKRFAVWGLSFKADTDDVRESPAITIVESLLEEGATIVGYDPEAMENFKVNTNLGNHLRMMYSDDQYAALLGADALIILTEWPRFRAPNFRNMVARLNSNSVIFDARNLLEPSEVIKAGMNYISIGRKDFFV